MADRKKVSIQYRRVAPITGFATALQAAVASAMKYPVKDGTNIGADVAARQCTEDLDYGTVVLNYIDDKTEYFFGEIVRFEPGADLPLLKLAKGNVYNLTQAKAPDGHEAIRGVLYFMSIGDHILLLESGVAASRLERYFTWLLTHFVQTIPKGAHVILDAEFTSTGDARKLAEVEHVMLRPRPISEPAIKAATDIVEDAQVTAKRDVSATNTRNVLVAAGLDSADIDELIADKTDLEVRLEIRFKTENRRRKVLGVEKASRLLRNLPEDELTLSGPGGREKDGKIVKLAYPANVMTVGSLLDSKDVARALFEAHKYFVTNGFID